MKKQIFTLFLLLIIFKYSNASVLVTPINVTLDSLKTNYQLDVNGDSEYDFTFNSFANGSFTITGRVGNGKSFFLATGSISGSNNFPVKIKNNQTFTNLTTWKSNSIFIQSPNLNYTDFKGKGNKYIGGRMQVTGMPEFYYFWILVNVSADGSKLNLIKSGFETEADLAISTENEGIDDNPNTSINNLKNQNVFTIFPNPANTEITIQSTLAIKEYKIYNLSGVLVSEPMEFTFNKINVSHLEKGIYLLQVLDKNNHLFTQKLIIENN